MNLLLALTDPMNVHHETAHIWFAQTGRLSWATCPITENGFVRIASHPRYPNRPGSVGAVLEILSQLCAAEGHQFWSENVSIRDLIGPDQLISHAQVTDAFLLGLAVHQAGKLATLDQRLPVAAVRGGADRVELIT
ncbi:MAG TPA: TA system VapC family ribonuclease toxin [Chloroflexota bacterium]|nr:TA system VapC family ribonuclease toxin [Chloroflexota bacterium]